MADSRPTVNEPLFVIKAIGMFTCWFMGFFSLGFNIWKGNDDAIACALVLIIVLGPLFHLNGKYKKGKLREKVKIDHLITLLVVGVLVAIAMFALMIFFTLRSIQQKKEDEVGFMQPGDRASPAILSGLASFWGVVLAYDSFRFKRMLQGSLPI